MPKRATPLTVRRVEQEQRLGLHADGNGLYLHVGPGSKSWVFRYQIAGRRRDMGIGPLRLYGLKEARDKVIDLARGVRNGIDPLDAKRDAAIRSAVERAKQITFADAAHAYIAAHQAEWRDKRSWPDSIAAHVNPVIGDLPVSAIDTALIRRVLDPIWATKTKTAMRVRGRIETILDWAVANEYRDKGDNPARWKGHLDKSYAKPSKIVTVTHHGALPYADIPAFMAKLRQRPGTASAAIEFAILTCARAGEVLGATWAEIDLRNKVWTCPAARMKAGQEQRVPLSGAALAVLDRMRPLRRNSDDHIFLGTVSGRPMSSPSLLQALEPVWPGVTVHGFRSTFRDWAAEKTNFPREIAEAALAHINADKVEASYRRSDLLDKRRELADAWAAHCGA
jgi:integrase